MRIKVTIICTIYFILVFISNVYAIDNISKKEDNSVVVYSIDSNTEKKFIKNPTIDVLLSNKNTVVNIYKNSELQQNTVERKNVYNGTEKIDRAKSGVMRIGLLPVYNEFLDYVGNIKNIQKLLNDKEIQCNIEYYALLECIDLKESQIPLTIWVKTDIDNFFITIEEIVDYDNPQHINFNYNVYNYDRYYDKFSEKNGTLRINGCNSNRNDYVEFWNGHVSVSFRSIVEALGCEVSWHEEKNMALFSKDNTEYVLRLGKYPSLVHVNDVDKISYPAPGEQTLMCEIINDRIIIGEQILKDICSIWKTTVKIDYDNLIIDVYK